MYFFSPKVYFDLVRIKVDLYSGCDSDATSNKIVAMEKRNCEIIAFFVALLLSFLVRVA